MSPTMFKNVSIWHLKSINRLTSIEISVKNNFPIRNLKMLLHCHLPSSTSDGKFNSFSFVGDFPLSSVEALISSLYSQGSKNYLINFFFLFLVISVWNLLLWWKTIWISFFILLNNCHLFVLFF